MDVSQDELEHLAAQLGQALLRHGWRLAVAESCTGGWAAQALTAVAGQFPVVRAGIRDLQQRCQAGLCWE
jgi:nicotinamide mononucleotide (NMN) deamidase PncC